MVGVRQTEEYLQISADSTKRRVLFMFLLAPCVAFYVLCTYWIILMSQDLNGYIIILGMQVRRFTVNALLAQGQVISAILITLNPVKRSHLLALLLCASSGLFSLWTVLMVHLPDALPGAVIPISTIVICLLINGYGTRLKTQLKKLLTYSRIVKKNESMLHSLAYYDVLTGLPNRKKIMDQIEEMAAQEGPAQKSFLLVYFDLDDFKKINDTMGHGVGDSILKAVAERWQRLCHADDLLARVSGDEFILVIRHTLDPESLSPYLDGFRGALCEPLWVGRKDFSISASIGVTRFPQDGGNADELLKNADIALNKAKRLGKNNCQFFSSAMREEVTRKIQLENDLLAAVRNNELFMVYQPQYRGGSRTLRGFEALARWKHPELGFISPAEFIPIAEEAGIIVDMGKWIIENVLNSFLELQNAQGPRPVLSVNISVRQILEPSFVDTVRELLAKTGFDSSSLEFEITESVFISCPEYVSDVIKKLKKLGIRIALDDFGTGYASLNYLQMLPVDVLKIDKTFVDKIHTDLSANQMVGAIISLSHKLGLEVIAEGVETEEQLRYLNDQGCDFIQGYLFSKPVDLAQAKLSYRASA